MKPLIAISTGDYNGIGPEIIIKAISKKEIRAICTPLLIGKKDIFEYYIEKLNKNICLQEFHTLSSEKKKENEIMCIDVLSEKRTKFNAGKLTKDAGAISISSLETGTALCIAGTASALVTAPVSKEAMVMAGFKFLGQTEFIASLCRVKENGMLLFTHSMRVALITIHHPLKNVAALISTELIHKKLNLLSSSLQNDFGISKPKIAVLGLNPHSGENGLLGMEEKEIIIPALKKYKRKNILIEGPFPADGFFGQHLYKNFDAVLAMYHDQGLTPLKMSGMDEGVNFTMGLPIVRTSPDHGTAFAIAGKGIATSKSMESAIQAAVKIIAQRKKGEFV
jgi:4-hydroxythreonine-4-phosphate dehydrogenase